MADTAEVTQRQQAKQKAKDDAKKAAEENYEKGQQAQEKMLAERAERDAPKVKPTPTDKEVVLAMHGAHVDNKEPDGSPEQPQGAAAVTKTAEAKPAAGTYATRQASSHKEK